MADGAARVQRAPRIERRRAIDRSEDREFPLERAVANVQGVDAATVGRKVQDARVRAERGGGPDAGQLTFRLIQPLLLPGRVDRIEVAVVRANVDRAVRTNRHRSPAADRVLAPLGTGGSPCGDPWRGPAALTRVSRHPLLALLPA